MENLAGLSALKSLAPNLNMFLTISMHLQSMKVSLINKTTVDPYVYLKIFGEGIS